MDIETLLDRLPYDISSEEQAFIRKAYEWADAAHYGTRRASGEPFIEHSLETAQTVAELGLDTATVAASLLHDVIEDTSITREELEEEFGAEVASLVDGVTKLKQIDELGQTGPGKFPSERAESLRKMFLAMADDVRVVMIKLADRLHNMRTLWALRPDQQQRIASETLEIFAPLTNRLGIWQIKWQLEDLSLRYLDPVKYREISGLVAEGQANRQLYLESIVGLLQEELTQIGITAEISGRPKHIYSIYEKMQRKGISFAQIYDVRAIRVLVDRVQDCYAALGVVHSLWRPIPGEFDDYIATPKDNMYQSLHTAVVTDEGKTLEVQIRTHEMHRRAEYGIAAHWRYKEHAKRDPAFEAKIAWLRSLMEWRQEVTDAYEFVDALKSDVFEERVYVFTPKGDIIDLPAGSTPIDFAFHIHTEIGYRCRGAKVDGKLVSLDHQLRNGEQVEILTTKRGGPGRDWLNPALGYVKTSRARQKIRQWFRRQDRDQNIARGRDLLDRELKRLGVTELSYEAIAKRFDYEKVDDFLAAIGFGDVNTQQIATRVMPDEGPERVIPTEVIPRRPSPTGVRVRGVGNLLTNLARCCNPAPGDEITGYITQGRGVTVHRCDCPNILYLAEGHRERVIEVEWENGRAPEVYPVVVHVLAYDRDGLLRDISGVVADENINMSAVSIKTLRRRNLADMIATLEIQSVSQLSRVLAKIEALPNVLEASRIVK
jgi:GTP pyrophosphokinase